MTRICLNMIVKNEAERIERCLASVAPHISCAVIMDTGSTDDTIARIHDFFRTKEIPAVVVVHDFVDFSATRNKALAAANGQSRFDGFGWDYLLLVDADMELVAPDGFPELTAPGYLLLQKSNTLSYWNTRLLRRDVGARYKGATHEYLETDLPVESLDGPYFIDHADGANRLGKCERDIALLRGDPRSVFYLANSYRDAGSHQDALHAYYLRARMGGWDEEVYLSRLGISRCLRALDEPEDAIGEALAAFNMRPTRAEPLYDLAKHYRELGNNEASLLFSTVGLATPKPNDLLFVESDVYEWGLRIEFSICAYYSKDESVKALGHDVCNGLALDRNISRETRDHARTMLFWYAKGAAELMPSFAPQQIEFTPPKGYRAMNPSICNSGGRHHLAMIVRTVNYEIDAGGRYVMPPDEPAIRTRNFLVVVGDDDLSATQVRNEIPHSTSPYAAAYKEVLGAEDMRLFKWADNLWATATEREGNPEGWAEQVLMQVTDYGELKRHILAPKGPREHQKNWMPLVDRGVLRLIYRCDPTRIVDEDGETIFEEAPGIAAETFSGGSQAIQFDGGWLALIHEAITSPIDGKRCYQHRFVWFDADLHLKKASRRFWFQQNNQIEFAAGLCWHPDEERLIISYGIRDCEAWLATVVANDVRSLLGKEVVPDQQSQRLLQPDKSQPPLTSGGFLSADEARARLAVEYDWTRLGRFDDDTWVRGQTNRALQERSAIERARKALKTYDLPLHPDYPKSWDSYLALYHAVATTPLGGSRVLDAGGTRDSVFLPGLARLGYRNLINFNLDEPHPETVGSITYAWGDITRIGAAPGSFHFVACLSVLEHGVDWRLFLPEMADILAPGGHLFLSVDFWETPIDTRSQMAFGAPVKVFAPFEIMQLTELAQKLGLRMVGELDWRCREPVVKWLGLDFTFLNLLFCRE